MMTPEEKDQFIKSLGENKSYVLFIEELIAELKNFTTLDSFDELELKLRARAYAVNLLEEKLLFKLKTIVKGTDKEPTKFR